MHENTYLERLEGKNFIRRATMVEDINTAL